jgi:putative redox protein
MKTIVDVDWMGDMAFDANIDGHHIVVDASQENGGNNVGPRPKPLMLVALAGCTGMDVVSILKKMRVDITALKILVEGETADEHPKKYKSMKLIYQFSGNNLEYDKLDKAVRLSEEKYCGVMAFYNDSIKVGIEIRIV